MNLALSRTLPTIIVLFMCFPASAVTVSPATVTVQENATRQFSASLPSTWTTNCGAISSTGLFKAPLYPHSCTVTAKATNGSGSSTATVTVVSPIMMTPVSATTPLGMTQQFTASVPVAWTAGCGSITAGGLFTAAGSVGTFCTVEGIATGNPKYTVYGYDKIGPAPAPLTVTPIRPTVTEGATQQFTASSSATFSASCGTISASGLFTAPLVPASCTVTAKNSIGTTATAVATVVSPLIITPGSAATGEGQSQQFTANLPVVWTASCGSISASGLYIASVAPGSVCKINAVAATGTAYSASVLDTVASPPAPAIAPQNAMLSEGSTLQFTSNVVATWASTCGSIGATTGLYTAPMNAGPCTVTAKPSFGSGAASTLVAVTSPLFVVPGSATTAQWQTQQFTSSMPATWTSSCGGINPSSGLFLASASQGTVCNITATATGSAAYTTTVSDTIAAAGSFTIAPAKPSIVENVTLQFTANGPATWVASCGTVDPNAGLFTAPLSSTVCTVTANAIDGSNRTASTNVSVTSPLTLAPATVNLHALNTQSFTASQAVTWAASCGTISSAGVFTAPASAGTCTITATATGTPAYTAQANVNVDVVNQLRWRNNAGGTGLQSNELSLTPASITSPKFGQAWSSPVDGGVWAEPLYINGLSINRSPHNVLFVETDNDSVYALDADTGAQLWTVSLLPPGATAVAGTMVTDPYIPSIGVLGTPVIDDGTLYVVAETAEEGATYFPHRLHALDITSGNERFGGPVLISDPNLPPMFKLQRPGLAIANGNVYVALGSLGDRTPYHGLLFAFNETTLAQTAVWNSTPTGSSGGIWQAGGAPSVDSAGNVYVLTGNGTADGVSNFGESAVKLSSSLQVLDSFSPYNAATLSASDLDLGSASVPVMPDQNGQFPHELIFCGKFPVIYVLNRDSMGRMGASSDNIVQELTNAVGGTATTRDAGQSCFTSPSAWGQYIYFAANGDVLKQFSLNPNTGLLSTSPVYQGSFAYGWPGSQSVISSNGNAAGIIWTFDNVGKKLRADDASNVSNSLYVSPAINTGYLKWTTPTVINGHVYVGGKGIVVAFALTN